MKPSSSFCFFFQLQILSSYLLNANEKMNWRILCSNCSKITKQKKLYCYWLLLALPLFSTSLCSMISCNHFIQGKSSVRLELLNSFPRSSAEFPYSACTLNAPSHLARKGVNKALSYNPNALPAVSDVCVGCHVSALSPR